MRKETEEIVTGGSYLPPPGYYTFWPYWNMAYGGFYATSSYTKENVIVRVEFNLYSTKDEKLVWSGESDTLYSKNFEKLVSCPGDFVSTNTSSWVGIGPAKWFCRFGIGANVFPQFAG